jgi:predicted dehydrogenase
MQRRAFLHHGSSAALASSLVSSLATKQGNAAEPIQEISDATGANTPATVTLGIMGMQRGLALAKEFLKLPGVSIRYACDPDRKRAEAGAEAIRESSPQVEAIGDFQKMLDDPSVNSIVCAAPNHWHGPATILACQAGKHVYVEKPCSHNPAEGQWMIRAAEKFNRCVQVGTQRRSSLGIQEAMRKLHSGVIGKVYYSQARYFASRGSIGSQSPSDPPTELDYPQWLGPAPAQPFRTNVVHYNWHWFWDFGNGELGNNGIHMLDLARWGLQTTSPIRVVSSGGRYAFEDDQQTPDTQIVSFEFADGKQILYEGLSCSPHSESAFVSFHGTDGSMDLDEGGSYRIYNRRNQKIEEAKATGQGMQEHLVNFLDAVRSSDPKRLNQPILEGHLSTLLCHLGNIAQRTGRILRFDPQSQQILEDPKQQSLWERPYADGWRDRLAT